MAINKGAKLTADNFNAAFMSRCGDTDTVGRILTQKWITYGKREEDITGNPNSNDVLIDTGVIEFTGTGPYDVASFSFGGFPTSTVTPAISPASAPEDGQQVVFVNNTDTDITFSVFNPNKNYTLRKGCAMYATYCASSGGFAPDGQGESTPCMPIYSSDADYIASETLKHGSFYCNSATKTIRVWDVNENGGAGGWVDKRAQAIIPFYSDEATATAALGPDEDDNGLIFCDESNNTLKIWKWDSVSGTGEWVEKAPNPLKCCVEQAGHGFSVLKGVRYDNTAGAWILGNAGVGGIASSHVVVEVEDADNFCVQSYGPIDLGAAHGLTDCFYFDDPATAGAYTPTKPISPEGAWQNSLFQVISPTKLEIHAGNPEVSIAAVASGCEPKASKTIKQSSHGFDQWDQVSHNGTNWVPANSASATFLPNLFTVVEVVDANCFVIAESGIVTCPNSLTPNCVYYTANDASGDPLSITPDTYYSSGDIVQPAFFVIDNQCIKLMNGLNNYILP